MCLISLICHGVFAEKPEVKIRTTYSPNLLENPNFQNRNGKKFPDGWVFSNMANGKGIQGRVEKNSQSGCNMLRIDTPGDLPGYWSQAKPIPVKEGVTYYARIDIKSENTRTLLWLQTEQWHDGKNPLNPPLSQTRIFSYIDGSRSKESADEIGLFVDPQFVKGHNKDEWYTLSLEFTVPLSQGVTDYDFRAGAYFGSAGWILLQNPYLGEAKRRVRFEVSGYALASMTVHDSTNKQLAEFKLKPDREKSSVSMELPSCKESYKWVITTINGKTYNGVF